MKATAFFFEKVMKKILIAFFAVFLTAAAYWAFQKKSSSENRVNKEDKLTLFSNFEANVYFKMSSHGTFMGNQEGGLKIHTNLEGYPVITFDKNSGLLKLVWSPVMVLKVNDVLKEDYKNEFDTVKNETFYAHFNKQMVMDKIYYSKRAGISPAVQEMILNFNKMLAHQAAWYFTLAPLEKTTAVSGVDIWGETIISLDNNGATTTAKMKSIENKSIQNGTGDFEITREADGKVLVEGSQKAVMGNTEGSTSMASTLNEYSLKTKEYRELGEMKIEVDLSQLESTLPWMVVDAKAMKENSIKEKLKNWDKNKLSKAVFGFKLPANPSYKDVAELSGIISDMLYMDHTLAKTYYEWVKKLRPDHPLYGEFLKALGVVGCSECQEMILKITDDYRNNEAATQKSLVAVGFVENPEAATEEKMRELGEDKKFKNSVVADFMLGNFASALADKDQERSKKIDEDFVKKLKKSSTKNEILRYLGALGNSGQCTDYESIVAFTKNPDLDIRKDAVMALRNCKNENVDKLYRTLFTEKGELRMIIVQAVEMRITNGINLDQQFDFFVKWVESQSSTLDQQEMGLVAGLLKSFSRQDGRFLEQYNLIKKNCSKNNTCAYFN